MSDASVTNTALLVQLLEQMGGMREDVGTIKNQLAHGERRFDIIDDKLDSLESKQDITQEAVEPLTVTMAVIEPKVKTMELFLGKKLAPIVAVASAFVAVVLWLIAITAGAAFTWVKALVNTHLNWH